MPYVDLVAELNVWIKLSTVLFLRATVLFIAFL